MIWLKQNKTKLRDFWVTLGICGTLERQYAGIQKLRLFKRK